MVELTKNQKAILRALTTPNKPANEHIRWMEDDSIVEFTEPSFTYSNAEFQINHSKIHKIWFSQLSNFGLTEDLELFCCSIIFKNGIDKTLALMDVDEFWKDVKGKQFKVGVPFSGSFIFNKDSSKWSEANLDTYYDAFVYVEKCAKENRLRDIGDLIRPGSLYSLTEV